MPFPYLTDRRSLSDAEELIARHGPGAGHEAAVRANRSRGLGNHIHFCRWRQIERLIAALGEGEPSGRLH